MSDAASGLPERSILLVHPDSEFRRRMEIFILAQRARLARCWGWHPGKLDAVRTLAGRGVGPEVGLIIVHLHRPVGGTDEIERIWSLRAVERRSVPLVGLTFEIHSAHGVFKRAAHALVQYPLDTSSLLAALLKVDALPCDRVVSFAQDAFARGDGLLRVIASVENRACHGDWDAVRKGIETLRDQLGTPPPLRALQELLARRESDREAWRTALARLRESVACEPS